MGSLKLSRVENEKPFIIIGTESELDESIKNSEVFPSGYNIFRKDRIDANRGGGVFVAVHNSIIATRQPQLDCQAETIWIKIEMAEQEPLYIYSFILLSTRKRHHANAVTPFNLYLFTTLSPDLASL